MDNANVNIGDVLNGPLSTVGSDIVDADGLKVDLQGVNWFGLETDVGAPHGLWARNMEDMLDDISDFGFNLIRLPFAGELATNDRLAESIDTTFNPELAGLTSLEVMEEFLNAAAERGIGVLLDMHRTTPGDGPEEGGRIPDVDVFLDQWAAMAEMFGDHPAVIGFDLYNEPHGYEWDEWASIAEQAGNMLLESHPDELIIVEGVETYQGDSHWWGGNLQGVADRPVELNVDNRLVYSPHEYATSVFEQPYFTEAGYDPETTLPEIFRENWGFIEEEGIAPLLLGEFGSTFDNQIDIEWAPVLADYLLEHDIDWTIWSWNPNSGDTGGVVENDWVTPREDAFTYLLDVLLAESPGDSGGSSSPIVGTSGADTLIGSDNDDVIDALAGNDSIFGGIGTDQILGGTGLDEIHGGDGGDLIYGGDGRDEVYAGSGDDTVDGGNGRDIVELGDGDDVFLDNSQNTDFGNDSVSGGNGSDVFYGGGGNDIFKGNAGRDIIFGDVGSDQLFGGIGADQIFGGDGRDEIYAGSGHDTVDGGNGRDIVELGDGNDVFLDNSQNTDFGNDSVSGGNGRDVFYGGGGNDIFEGDAGRDIIFGDIGSDQLFGGNGGDWLSGGVGNDTLTGGSGNDTFAFSTGDGADTITDFEVGTDIIQIVGGPSFADLDISSSGSDAVVSFGSTSISIENVSATALDEDNFEFL